MNNESFLIENSNIDIARDLCKYIEEPEIRSRSVANVLAAKISTNFFQGMDMDVDVETGLHNTSKILKDLDISDIYVNGSFVDIRLYFNENEIYIPKSHFEYNILPTAYMFIKLDDDISTAVITGFINPENIDTTNEYNGYYKIKEEDLVSYYDIENLLYTDRNFELPQNYENLVYDYLEDKVEDKTSFYQMILNSVECRDLLRKASRTQDVFKYISKVKNEEPVYNETLELLDNQNYDLSVDLPLDSETEVFETLEDNFEQLDLEDAFIEELSQKDSQTFDLEEEAIVDIKEEEEVEVENPEDNSEIENFLEESSYNTEYKTEITPSIDSIDNIDFDEDSASDDYENILDELSDNEDNEDNQDSDSNNDTEEFFENDFNIETSEDEIEEPIEEEEEEEEIEIEADSVEEQGIEEQGVEAQDVKEIEELFDNDSEDVIQEDVGIYCKKKKNIVLPILGLLTVALALGYYGFKKFSNNDVITNNNPEPIKTAALPIKEQPEAESKTEAMPIETIENIKAEEATNEGLPVSIPEIENNLDTSILISNLSVKWEVPAGYINNTVAKRYFVKIGKVIQLNLKTELLLLSKPPVTNKIAVELSFNKNLNKFEVKNLTTSSGEKDIDDLILKTISKVLESNYNSNLSSLGNIQGNPVLVINL